MKAYAYRIKYERFWHGSGLYRFCYFQKTTALDYWVCVEPLVGIVT
ncbi:hypothetical protein [Photorhabdus akhurstii]